MNKKTISIILMSIFLISTAVGLYESVDDVVAADKSYIIDLADVFVNVNSNGLLNIKESYTYTFHGQYNGVYRDIPLKSGESIDNLTVDTGSYYNKVEVSHEGENEHIKVYLYKDAAKTQPIKDSTVVIQYSYDFVNVTKLYNDVGELQYKVWGTQWDKAPKEFNAHVTFPSSNGVQYWINPVFNGASSSWDGNTINIHCNEMSTDKYLEVRATIPLSEFNNATYARHINQNGYDEIVKIQEDYQSDADFQNNVFLIIPIILFVSLVYPLAAYKKYGGSPKTTYTGQYEHEIPTDDTPMFVNALFSTKSSVGTLDNNGIQAAIMEMINDNVIGLENEEEDLNLILPESANNLKPCQKEIIDLLKIPAKDNVLNMKKMKDELTNREVAKEFNEALRNIENSYKKENIEPVLGNYFSDKGSTRILMYALVGAIIGFILPFVCMAFSDIPNLTYCFWGSIVFLIICIALFFLPDRNTGRWTQEGIDEFSKWQAFERFIKDFSLIKEHPPESIAIWNEYLIYATALGDAKAVIKAMKDIGPVPETSSDYDLYCYGYHDGPEMFYTAAAVSRVGESNSDSGSVGGAGGGSGGGGGGAF